MKNQFNQKGFTLIELLVVITIIAILASVSVPVFSSIQQKAKVNKSMQQASGIYKGVYALYGCLLYTSPSPRDATLSRMPSSA